MYLAVKLFLSRRGKRIIPPYFGRNWTFCYLGIYLSSNPMRGEEWDLPFT